jgi:hypothetical protein
VWAAHIKTISDEMLQLLADEGERQPSDAELEAIIWPAEL